MGAQFQFSMRFLLASTAAVAAGVAAFNAEPSIRAALAIDFLTVVFVTAAIVGAVLTGGMTRTFWIGAAVMLGTATVIVADSVWSILLHDSDAIAMAWAPLYPTLRRWLAALWCAAPINGLFAVCLHWLFTPRRPPA